MTEQNQQSAAFPQVEHALQAARTAGISHILIIGIGPEGQKYMSTPGNTIIALGLAEYAEAAVRARAITEHEAMERREREIRADYEKKQAEAAAQDLKAKLETAGEKQDGNGEVSVAEEVKKQIIRDVGVRSKVGKPPQQKRARRAKATPSRARP